MLIIPYSNDNKLLLERYNMRNLKFFNLVISIFYFDDTVFILTDSYINLLRSSTLSSIFTIILSQVPI